MAVLGGGLAVEGEEEGTAGLGEARKGVRIERDEAQGKSGGSLGIACYEPVV